MKKANHELSAENIMARNNFIDIDFWKGGGGTAPNLLYRSNYFVCHTDNGHSDGFVPFELYHQPNNTQIQEISYKGYRGTILDARMIYALLNLSKGKTNDYIPIAEKDLIIGMGYHPHDPTIRKTVFDRIDKLSETIIKIEYPRTIAKCLLLGNTVYSKPNIINGKAFYLCKIPDEFGFLLEYHFNTFDNKIIEMTRSSDMETRLYFYLGSNTKQNPYLKTESLINMINPDSKNRDKLLKNIKYRVFPSMEKKGIIAGWGYKDNHKNVIEFIFKNTALVQVTARIKTQKKESKMLKRRSPELVKKMKVQFIKEEVKKEHEQKSTEFKSRKKEQVIEILDYWESLGRPKYRARNKTHKTFMKTVKAIRLALEGKLYEGKSYNQVFEITTIKKAVQEFDNHIKRTNSQFLAKLKLLDFFVINELYNNSKEPFLVQYCEKEEQATVNPVNKKTQNYVFSRYKVRSKKQKLSQEEKTLLTIMLNKIEARTIKPLFLNFSYTEEDVYSGKISKKDTETRFGEARYVNMDSGSFDYIYEIAFDLILNYQEESMPSDNQEYNSKGLDFATDRNFLKKIQQRINWIKSLHRMGNKHPKYEHLPNKNFKE